MHRNCRIPIESKLSHHPNAQKRGKGRYLCTQISSHKVAAPFACTLVPHWDSARQICRGPIFDARVASLRPIAEARAAKSAEVRSEGTLGGGMRGTAGSQR